MPETVLFKTPIKVLIGDKVEHFLNKIQDAMQQSLKYQTQKCYAKYKGEIDQFKEWLFADFPAQCLSTVALIKWQENTVNAIN